MDKEVNGHLYIANDNLKRIADALEKTTNYRTGEVTELRGIRNALEEVLRLVKADQEKMKKIREESEEDIEEEARLKDGDDEVSWSK
jgi:hypothetical protein